MLYRYTVFVVIGLFTLSACNLDAVEPTTPSVQAQVNAPITEEDISAVLPTLASEPTAVSQPEVQLVSQTNNQPAAIQIPAPPQQPLTAQLDPVLLLASFYNAVNLRDYGRAYSYWESPPRNASLSQFTQGYADTAAVLGLVRLPLREGVAAGSSYASMQTALMSIRNNGSQQVYTACYVGRRSNVPAGNSPTPDPNWRFYDGRAISTTGPVTTGLIDQACVGTPYDDPGYTGLLDPYDYRGSPITLLQSYYNAINRREYQRAYGYWETPPGGASLAQFSQGYAATASVAVYVGLSIREEGAAGSVYTALPTLLIAANTDGSQQVFAGCYVARRSNVSPDSTWWLYSASITPVSDWDPIPANPPIYIGAEIMTQQCA